MLRSVSLSAGLTLTPCWAVVERKGRKVAATVSPKPSRMIRFLRTCNLHFRDTWVRHPFHFDTME